MDIPPYKNIDPSLEDKDLQTSILGTKSPTPSKKTTTSSTTYQLYPNWNISDAPLSISEIEAIFITFEKYYGFQHDNVRNMFDHLLTLLDSRSARMTPQQALWSLHADYIGGENANYRTWYFVSQLDLDTSLQNKAQSKASHQFMEQAKQEWQEYMMSMSDFDRISQLALYLLIWGEASTLRYMPELLCFIFKLADDRRLVLKKTTTSTLPAINSFLTGIITPLYHFARDQSYQMVNGQCIRKEKDHNKIIGYDDINQLFWNRRAMANLVLSDGVTLLKNIPPSQRYEALPFVDWSSAFKKTFYESRSSLHLFTNFSRFWVIHIATFWYFMAAHMDFLYVNPKGGMYPLPVKLSVVALGGLISVVFMLLSTIMEFKYLPSVYHINRILLTRVIILLVLAAAHVGASFYVIYFDHSSWIATTVASCQLGLGAIITIIFSIIPPSRLFRFGHQIHLATHAFTANFPAMSTEDRFLSILLWFCIFACKFIETYFFQTLSFRDAISTMATLELSSCRSDPLLGAWFCPMMPILASLLMFTVELVLFFLDTYLWYVIWNTVFSVSQAMRLGISIMTSWKRMFARLPDNMYTKITSTRELSATYLRKMACSQMWNAIVISMYREHLLSIDNLQWLMYKVYNKSEMDDAIATPTMEDSESTTATTTSSSTRGLARPAIFDPNNKLKRQDCFPEHSEAERRLSFFAQSLAADIPTPYSVQQMPTFTVFTPHYSEKVLLSLREIIREEDSSSRVTLLEYLKKLHPAEWDHFVKDTKFIAEEELMEASIHHQQQESPLPNQDGRRMSTFGTPTANDKDDLPFYCIGFKSSAPEYTLRTRVWASLRAQTLYRTIAGFMNYSRALKILHRIEHPELSDMEMKEDSQHMETTEAHLDQLAQHKFRFLVAMQRYAKFNEEENENCEYLLTEFPHLQIAYIEEEFPSAENLELGMKPEPIYYSALIDGSCPILPNKKRQPRCRIRLPGNPILGDGKSDNQNHAIIFSRGEYLQLVDANQDNYLEECLKIRSIFREFENDHFETMDNDNNDNIMNGNGNDHARSIATFYKLNNSSKASPPPVAIVGAREYIFSENVGVLGDIAAGKEQTFGTLTQRIMAKTGGRLHYGHPDFLNAVFMTTRGGVSKAQRGLHLNEDIYAGMNAISRGGRIKHTEYLQCGKGRDLGFCSILNFTTKIGTGMGEQLLSREYYYLGTQLPIDRFLTFFYAHPGFHMNNIMIIFAVQIFLFCMMVVGTMAISIPQCTPFQRQDVYQCMNATPIYDWLKRCIMSIFMVLFISFLPLFLQELSEKGTKRSVLRLAKQLISLSPFFEVFVTQIYANAVLSNLSFGGARYIATGRGFATSRLSFSVLFSRFANPSIYFGARTMFMLLLVSLTVWIPHLIYFWATVSSLVISPFIFNPHQFVWTEFILDYREYLLWLIRGNGSSDYKGDSWITYCRQSRTRVTGIKNDHQQKIKKRKSKEKLNGDDGNKKKQSTSAVKSTTISPKARFSSIFISEIVMPFIQAAVCFAIYCFIKSRDDFKMGPGGALARIGFITISPIAVHGVLLLVLHVFSLLFACIGLNKGQFGNFMATAAHLLSVLVVITIMEYFWWLEHYVIQTTLLGLLSIFSLQRFIFKTFVAIFLTRELPNDASNRAWWMGNWRATKVGKHALREFVCKIVEMSIFTNDFILGHLILFGLFPITCIPYIDRLHSLMLLWLKPSNQIRPSVLSTKQRQRRNRTLLWFAPLFIFMLCFSVALVIIPLMYLKPLIPIKPISLFNTLF